MEDENSHLSAGDKLRRNRLIGLAEDFAKITGFAKSLLRAPIPGNTPVTMAKQFWR